MVFDSVKRFGRAVGRGVWKVATAPGRAVLHPIDTARTIGGVVLKVNDAAVDRVMHPIDTLQKVGHVADRIGRTALNLGGDALSIYTAPARALAKDPKLLLRTAGAVAQGSAAVSEAAAAIPTGGSALVGAAITGGRFLSNAKSVIRDFGKATWTEIKVGMKRKRF